MNFILVIKKDVHLMNDIHRDISRLPLGGDAHPETKF